MLTVLFGLAVLIMKLWPKTPVARWLHGGLVELPLELVGRTDRKYLILVGLIMFGGQFVLILGPELAMIYAMNLSLYGEALIATTFASAVVRVRYVCLKSKRLIASAGRVSSFIRTRPRPRRTRGVTLCRKTPANDDDHVWVWSLRTA